jgi:hypothetical protein
VEVASHKQQGLACPAENRGVGAVKDNLDRRELAHLAPDRCAYVRSVNKRLAEKRTALELVKRKVDRAITAGRIARSEQLVNAEHKANDCLLAVENLLARLVCDFDDDWEDSRFRTDIALEELSKSVKQMVARFT